MELRQRVLQFVQKEGLIPGEETLLVGVSGGPDSVCLLHILNQLEEALGVSLHVVHLNHMLRGAAGYADADYVSLLAQRLGLPATVESRDVLAYKQKHRLSLEEAARQIRYDFFAEVAASLGARRVALGHTADDQMETILMHLVRGSGLAGLRGMQPLTRWRSPANGACLTVVRPLLEVTRKETEAYCQAHALEPRSDLSNYCPDHMRNCFRHELVPWLESFNPNVRAALLRTARVARDAISYLEQQLSLIWDQVVREQPDGLLLDARAVATLHPALKQHLMRQVVEHLRGEPTDIESVHIENMLEALSKPAGKRLYLPGGLVLHVGYDTCLVSQAPLDACNLSPLEGEYRFNLDGETVLPGWRVKSAITTCPPLRPTSHSFRAHLDLDAAGRVLLVRRRRPGDRFQPLGMKQPKKLQDFMVDAKIPRALRDHVPLVCSPEQIVWVVGWRIAEQVKIKDTTQETISLEFQRL